MRNAISQSQPQLLEEYAAAMTSAQGRDLLRFLYRYGRSLKRYSFELRNKGYLRTARYKVDNQWLFAFIVNRANVLFYIRKAGRLHPGASLKSLGAHFPDAKLNSRDEIQFHVSTEEQARHLMEQLFE
jgi:hypothetical protein